MAYCQFCDGECRYLSRVEKQEDGLIRYYHVEVSPTAPTLAGTVVFCHTVFARSEGEAKEKVAGLVPVNARISKVEAAN